MQLSFPLPLQHKENIAACKCPYTVRFLCRVHVPRIEDTQTVENRRCVAQQPCAKIAYIAARQAHGACQCAAPVLGQVGDVEGAAGQDPRCHKTEHETPVQACGNHKKRAIKVTCASPRERVRGRQVTRSPKCDGKYFKRCRDRIRSNSKACSGMHGHH